MSRVRGAVLLVLLIAMTARAAVAGESDVASVAFYASGRETLLPMTWEMVRRLVHLCETQLQAADGAALRMSAAETLRQTRQHEVAIEIRYRQPVGFTIAYGRRRIHITHLQVPLTGTLGEPGETDFLYLGTPGPPYFRRGGKAAIVALLRELELPLV